MTAHGFAFPLVVLLSFVVGLTVAVAMNRQTAQSRTVHRQVVAYQEHHAARGVQEAISAWLRSQDSSIIGDQLGANGHALDIDLADSSVVSVYLSDGQGTVLGDISKLPANQRELAAKVLDSLDRSVTRARFLELTREAGPRRVSLLSAPDEVVRAVAHAVLEEGNPDRFVRAVLDARASGSGISRQDVAQAAVTAGASNTERGRLVDMLTTTPELWFVRVEARGGRGVPSGRVTAAYGGYVEIPAQRSGRRADSTNLFERRGSFLTWERLDESEMR